MCRHPSGRADGGGLLPEMVAKYDALSDAIRQVQRSRLAETVLGAEQVQFEGVDLNELECIDNSGSRGCVLHG